MRWWRSSRPRFQVDISTNTPRPNASGNQPPSTIFTTFALKKPTSTSRNAPNSATHAGRLQRQIRRATTNASTVVIAIVPVTAIPYAAARLVDDPKPSTSATTPTNSIRLMPGR